MDPLVISIKDARRALSLGTTKIYELINQNQLATIKIGRRTLITMESVDALVAQVISVGDAR